MSTYDGPYSGGHGFEECPVTSARTDAESTSRSDESQASVLLGGLAVVVFGLAAVLAAIGMGWVGAAVLGMVLLVVAWKVPTRRTARAIRFVVAGFGVLALLGALFDL